MKLAKVSKLLVMVMLSSLLLTACLSDKDMEKEFVIGISQLAEHPALDDARLGFEDGLKELGVNAKVDYQNAQGEPANAMSIAEKFAKDKVDLIYAIATPAAQTAKQVTSDIPLLFSAITDPVDAELIDSMEIPGGNITGTSDAAPIDVQLALFKKLDPSIEKVGIIFDTSEPNSKVQIDIAKDIGKDLGLEIVDMGLSNINDIPQVTDSIIKKVDAIYTITDNTVASAIAIVAKKARENKMITIGAESAHVSGGILLTEGISYYELGRQTARMAKEILVDGKKPASIPSEFAADISKAFNENTLEALDLDKNHEIFKDAKKISD